MAGLMQAGTKSFNVNFHHVSECQNSMACKSILQIVTVQDFCLWVVVICGASVMTCATVDFILGVIKKHKSPPPIIVPVTPPRASKKRGGEEMQLACTSCGQKNSPSKSLAVGNVTTLQYRCAACKTDYARQIQ